MEKSELLEAIESEFKKAFPYGWFRGSVGAGLAGEHIVFSFGLIGDMDQMPSKILANDPVHHKFIIYCNDGLYVSEDLQSGISTKPPAGSFLAMGRIKTKYRKTKGDSVRVLRSFNQLFNRTQMLIIENESIIYGREKYSNKFFQFSA